MLKFYISFLVLFLAKLSSGQSVISDVVPNYGDVFVYNQNDGAPPAGDAGADISWDFSSQTIDEYTANYTVAHASDVDGGDQFPDANMAWIADLGFLTLNLFISFDNNAFTDYGTLSTIQGTSTGRVFDDPRVHFTYPLNYQDTGEDTFNGSLISQGPGSEFSGNLTYIVDGYGTLATPYDTYPNVLRITTTSQEDLTTLGVTSTIETTTSSWYSPAYPVPVLTIERSTEYLIGNLSDSSSTITALVSYEGSPDGIELLSKDNLFEIYPNPAHNYIQLHADFQGSAQMEIYNVAGKKVLERSVHNQQKMDIQPLPSGYYIATLTVNGAIYGRQPLVVK